MIVRHKSLFPNNEMSNKEFTWFGIDTPERFQENLINKTSLMKANGWYDSQPFTYKFNQQGFRSDEFSSSPSAMILGCSHSFGIGLPFEETWAVKVSRSLGLRCVNLAWPGSSNDTTFRTAYNYIKKINPAVVIFLSPAPARFDLVINDTSLITFLPADGKSPSDPEPDPAFCKFYETWVLSDSNILLNRIKNTLAIKQLCQENNIKFVSHRVEDIAPVDLARDLIHSGVKTNTNLANSILKKI